jgi:nucleoside-diphosphate-sugar epimerase
MAKNPQPTIAITGANGFLGTILVTHFTQLGWNVIGLVRQPKDMPARKHTTYRTYDIERGFNADVLEGANYLVHAAYIPYDPRKHPNALQQNITSAQQLLEASRVHRLKKNIFISTMSAHDQAESVYGKQKRAIEALFNTDRDINLSCGLIVGNGGIVGKMVAFMRSKHVVPLIGGGTQPLQSIAAADLARIIERVIAKDLSGTLTVAHPDVFTYKQFYQTIAAVFGIKVVFVPVPLWTLMVAVRIIGMLHIPVGFSEDNVLGLKMLRSVDNAADMQRIGIEANNLEQALKSSGIQAQ